MTQNRREFITTLGAATLLPMVPSLLRAEAAVRPARAPARFKVRTITAGVQVAVASMDPVQRAIEMLRRARPRVEAAGYVVEGVRVTTSPVVADVAPAGRTRLLAELQALDAMLGAEHASLSLGPVLRANRSDPGLADWLVELARTTRHMSFSAVIASSEGGVHREASQTIAEVILALSRSNPEGSANFRFAAIANMPSGSPFFPGGYHEGPDSFSIGLESPNLVFDAFTAASDPADGEARLRKSMSTEYAGLERAALAIAQDVGFAYLGIDSSPAPAEDSSIGAALEALTHVPFGAASTLQACAAVTAAIKSLEVKTCGYSGLMLPVLEDPVLAARAREGRYGLRELMLYSSVCGTGLDCVPIPGNTDPARIARVLDDVATMSTRLRKPLTARLMPAQGKAAGEPTAFGDSSLLPSTVFGID
jgi:uncharacterized protein